MLRIELETFADLMVYLEFTWRGHWNSFVMSADASETKRGSLLEPGRLWVALGAHPSALVFAADRGRGAREHFFGPSMTHPMIFVFYRVLPLSLWHLKQESVSRRHREGMALTVRECDKTSLQRGQHKR